MIEDETRGARLSSPPADKFLAAPSDRPVKNTPGRSTSVAPSNRSTQSHTTTVEEKEDYPEFDVPDLKKNHLRRQQTYKIDRSLSLMDRLRGVVSPQWLMTQMEKSIEVVPSQVPDDEIFHRTKSPWIVDVYISPKYDSTNFYQTRCLLDTGCSHGNIVSKDLIKQLGYMEADYRELSDVESREAITLAGQPFPVEAAILLSWHHNTSLKRFRQMRFLISSQAKTYDMVIGAQTIYKYNLLSQPVFSLDHSQGLASHKSPDVQKNYLVTNRSTLESRVTQITRQIEREASKEKNEPLKKELLEVNHLLDLQRIKVDLRGEKDKALEKSMQAKLEEHTKAWDSNHPENTTKMVSDRFWAHRKKAPSIKASPTKVVTKSSGDQTAQTKKASFGDRLRRII